MNRDFKRDVERGYVMNMTQLEVPRWCTFGDFYATLLTVVALLPMIFVYLFSFLLQLPLLLGCSIYSTCVLPRAPLRVVKRGCSFYVLVAILFPLSAPLIALAFVWVWVLRLFRFWTCLPIALCRWRRTCRSFSTLDALTWRPRDFTAEAPARSPVDLLFLEYFPRWQFMDFVCALIGAIYRQGCCEFFLAIPGMVAYMPTMSVLKQSNPYLYDLEIVETNQWSDPIDADGDGNFTARDEEIIKRELKQVVFQTKTIERKRAAIDAWPFTGHYPYPTKNRKSETVLGVQFHEFGGGAMALTHSTHGHEVPGHTPKSATGSWNLVAVHLASWNAFNYYTAYVEVNVRRDGGVEHPMWVAADRSSRAHMNALVYTNRLFVELVLLFHAFLQDQPSFRRAAKQAAQP